MPKKYLLPKNIIVTEDGVKEKIKKDLKGSINVLSGLKHGITLGLGEALTQGGRVLGF